jgi:cytochrome b561
MKLKHPDARWGCVAKLLHWSVAALVIVQVPLGWTAARWPLTPTKLDLFVWHKCTGIVVLLLMAARVAWRAFDRRPPWPPEMTPLQRVAAQLAHGLLYALLLALPLTGWIVNSAANIPFAIFRIVPLPAIVPPDKALAGTMAGIHLALSVALVVVLVAHVGAALRHHFIVRDDVLARMLPGCGLKG